MAFFYFYHVVGARIFANQQYCQAEKLVENVLTLCFAGLCEKRLQIVAYQREELQRLSDLSIMGCHVVHYFLH